MLVVNHKDIFKLIFPAIHKTVVFPPHVIAVKLILINGFLTLFLRFIVENVTISRIGSEFH